MFRENLGIISEDVEPLLESLSPIIDKRVVGWNKWIQAILSQRIKQTSSTVVDHQKWSEKDRRISVRVH